MRRTAISVDDCLYSIGPNSPATDAIYGTWDVKDFRTNNDPSTQGTIAGWYCSVAGTPGTWVTIYRGVSSVSAGTGAISVTGTANAPVINNTGIGSVSVTPPITSTGGLTPTFGHANSGLGAATVAYPTSLTFDATGHPTAATAGTAPVTLVSGSTYISITGTTANPVVNNTGITTISVTPPITSTGGSNPTFGHAASSLGAATVAYPTSLTFDATGHPTAATAGTAPVTLVSGSTYISITGTTANPVVNNTGITTIGVTSPIASTGGSNPTLSHENSGATAATYAYPKSAVVNATGHVTSMVSGPSPFWSLQFGQYFYGSWSSLPFWINGACSGISFIAEGYPAPGASGGQTIYISIPFNDMNATTTFTLYIGGFSVGSIASIAASTTGVITGSPTATIVEGDDVSIGVTSTATSGGFEAKITVIGQT